MIAARDVPGLHIPPIFNNCQTTLAEQDEMSKVRGRSWETLLLEMQGGEERRRVSCFTVE